MKAFCEKYIVYFIAILLLVLLYKMFTYDERFNKIDRQIQAIQDNFIITSNNK